MILTSLVLLREGFIKKSPHLKVGGYYVSGNKTYLHIIILYINVYHMFIKIFLILSMTRIMHFVYVI